MSDIRLLHGDCLDLMAGIPDGSIDAIICDLPYGTTACKWDTVIPFEPLWKHYKRIIKRNGAIVLFGSQPFTSALVMSNPAMFRFAWIWEKSRATNFQQVKHTPLRYHEDVLVFGKSGKYNPQMEVGEPYHTRITTRGITGQPFDIKPPHLKSDSKILRLTRYPRSIITVPSMRQQDRLHPTQKPVALLEYLIRTYTNEGEVVLDNTMGSGTTGVACVNTDRDFIGIEKDAGYFQIAQTRIQDAQNKARQLTLEGVA